MQNLAFDEAYRSMYYFLEDYYNLTGSDEIGGMLGYMALLEDGSPADGGVLDDWQKAVARAKKDVESVKFRIINDAE